MRRIGIDFGRTDRRPGRIHHALAVLLAAAAAMASVQSFMAGRAERDAWELAQAEPPPDVPAPEARGAANDPVLARAGELANVQARLATPWEHLFNAIEAVPMEGVAMLELSGDSEARQLLIGLQAQDMKAMHAYLQAVGKTAGFDGVYLASHQVHPDADLKTIRFSVMTEWRTLAAP